MAARKPGKDLTLHDRLSRLSYVEACKHLGPGGAKLGAPAAPSTLH